MRRPAACPQGGYWTCGAPLRYAQLQLLNCIVPRRHTGWMWHGRGAPSPVMTCPCGPLSPTLPHPAQKRPATCALPTALPLLPSPSTPTPPPALRPAPARTAGPPDP